MNLHEICVSSYTFEVFDSVDFLITSRTEMIRKSKESDCELKKTFLRPENGRPHAKGSRMKQEEKIVPYPGATNTFSLAVQE